MTFVIDRLPPPGFPVSPWSELNELADRLFGDPHVPVRIEKRPYASEPIPTVNLREFQRALGRGALAGVSPGFVATLAQSGLNALFGHVFTGDDGQRVHVVAALPRAHVTRPSTLYASLDRVLTDQKEAWAPGELPLPVEVISLSPHFRPYTKERGAHVTIGLPLDRESQNEHFRLWALHASEYHAREWMHLVERDGDELPAAGYLLPEDDAFGPRLAGYIPPGRETYSSPRRHTETEDKEDNAMLAFASDERRRRYVEAMSQTVTHLFVPGQGEPPAVHPQRPELILVPPFSKRELRHGVTAIEMYETFLGVWQGLARAARADLDYAHIGRSRRFVVVPHSEMMLPSSYAAFHQVIASSL